MKSLGRLSGIKVYDGQANFLLLKLLHTDNNAPRLEADLLSRGIAVRLCTNFEGLDDRFIRIAVRSSRENERLVLELDRALNPAQTVITAKTRRKPAIMFLGTSSNAGKSVLTAAMGRILLQDGYRVAPFKAQNMSLNSHVTADGGEMGRAQVVQAQACRLAPDVRMNPVLLKPNSDMGSQVIVMGKPVGNMEVSDYINYKGRVFETVCRAYNSLASEMDVVVLEGAGSPAEVNLKSHDIVNLAMAEYAGAAAMLVGDIDRGGVFAAFAGTMDLFVRAGTRLDFRLCHQSLPRQGRAVEGRHRYHLSPYRSAHFRGGALHPGSGGCPRKIRSASKPGYVRGRRHQGAGEGGGGGHCRH